MSGSGVFIGESSAARKIRKMIGGAAAAGTHAILRGEPGVGKKTIASMIHEERSPKGVALILDPNAMGEIEINMLLDTPPAKMSTAVIRLIEEFSFLQQSMLMNFIQRYQAGSKVQILLTTTTDIAGGKRPMRILDELYTVIRKFPVLEIPSLAERDGDILLLVDHFMKNACRGLGIQAKTVDVNSLDFLVRREWKENIRELKFVIDQSVISSKQDILELPESMFDEHTQLEGMISNIRAKRSFAFDQSLSNLEKTLIEKALDVAGFNQSHAAKLLGVSESNLRYRLKKYKIVS